MPTETQDPAEALAALRERLRATQDAAQRLAEDAARERAECPAGGSGVPPAGWDVPHRADEAHAELDALVALLGTLRDVLPPHLRHQLAELARGLLQFVRAVLDWWVGRLEEAVRPAAPPLEDVPIAP